MARSKVWKYYDKLDHNTAQCQLCERIIKTCGNTSNLMKHIKTHPQINVNNDDAQVVRGMFKRRADDIRRRFRKVPPLKEFPHVKTKEEQEHDAEQEEFIGKSEEEAEVVGVYQRTIESVESVSYGWADTLEDPSQSPSTEDIIEFEPKQDSDAVLYQLHEEEEQLPQTDEDHIPLVEEDAAIMNVYQTPFSSHSSTQSLLSHLAYFVCRDRHPLDIIIGEGFKHLMQLAHPLMSYQPWPTVDQLAAYIETQTQMQVSRLRRKLAGMSTVSLSCALHEQNYLELMVHYHENRKRQSRILSVQRMSADFNVKQIVEHLESACERFDIQKSLIACVVTEGDNCLLQKAIESFLGENRHVPCFGHFMNSLITDIMQRPEVRNLEERIRLKIKKCPFSTFKAIEQCLRMEGNCLSTSEVDLAKQIICIVKPLTTSLRVLSGNCSDTNPPLASQTLPMIFTMVEELKRRSSGTELEQIYDLRMFIVQQLKVCFEDLEKNEHLALSTFLDPRFRNIPFQSGSLVANYMTHLYDLRQEELEQNDHIVIDPEDDSHEDYNIWAAYKSHCQEKYKRNGTASTHLDEDDEIASYFYDPLSNVQTEPMLLWKDLAQSHPFLHRLAKRYLHIPATAKRLNGSHQLLGEQAENILFMADVPFTDW